MLLLNNIFIGRNTLLNILLATYARIVLQN